MQLSKKMAVGLGVLGLLSGSAATVAAQTHASSQNFVGQTKGSNRPATVGTVTTISGKVITITDQRTNKIYTIDASSAAVQKIPQQGNSVTQSGIRPMAKTAEFSDIKTGDTVAVFGAISGSDIVAKKIVDGQLSRQHGNFNMGLNKHGAFGTVTAINGNNITMKGQNGSVYTIDASNAGVSKISSATVSTINIGDSLNVRGRISGNSIAASQITDGNMPRPSMEKQETSQ